MLLWRLVAKVIQTALFTFFDQESSKFLALLHQKQAVTCRDIIDAELHKVAWKNSKKTVHGAAQHQHWQRIAHNAGKAAEKKWSQYQRAKRYFTWPYTFPAIH